MKRIIVLNMVCMALLFTSCSSDNLDDMEITNPEGVTTYIVGSNGREDSGLVPLQALLWINDELTELTNGQTDAEAYSVYVSGSDVYVAGYEYEDGVSVAKYWKNGVGVALTDGSLDAIAYTIVINGNDVYVAGAERSEIPGGQMVAKYWKNGVATSLTDGSKGAAAISLAIFNNEVHVVGSESTGPGGVVIAKYWLNGSTINLTDETGDAFGTDISIDQGEVYISLRQSLEINDDDFDVASYWHDNQITQLETNTAFVGAFGILAENDNLYVCGTSQAVEGTPIVRFWLKNNDGISVVSDNTLGDAFAIAKLGDTVYYCGSIFSEGGSSSLAVYWKGNEMTILPSTGFDFVQATDIFVK